MACPFAAHKSIFGDPGQGVHSIRFFGVAFVDLAATVLAAALIAWGFKTGFLVTLLVLVLLGIIVHKLFCVDTALNKLIF